MQKQRVSPEAIARLADEGLDITSYFTNDGKIIQVEGGETDFTRKTIEEFHEAVKENPGTD